MLQLLLLLMLLLQHGFDGGCVGAICEKLRKLQIPQLRMQLLAVSDWLLAPDEIRFMS